jgi:hypothetical protein
MRAQTRHELAMGIVDLLQDATSDEQLADVLLRGQAGDPLTPSEQFQFDIRANALFRYWENVHYQFRAGMYDRGEYERQREAWRISMAGSAGAKTYWCKVRTLYSPKFAAELDAIASAAPCPAADKRRP